MALFGGRRKAREQALGLVAATLGWSYERDGGADIDALDYYLLPKGRPAGASEVLRGVWAHQVDMRVFSWEAHGASDPNHLGTSNQTISKLTCALTGLSADVHTVLLVPVSSRRREWGLPAQSTETELDRTFRCYSRRTEAVTALAQQKVLVSLLLDAPTGTAVEWTAASQLVAGPRLAPDAVTTFARFAADLTNALPTGLFRSEEPTSEPR
jgi:hypothetical protein